MSVRHVRPAHPVGLRNPGRTKQIGTDRRQHIQTDGAAGTRQSWPAETAFQCFIKKPSSLFYVSLHGFIFFNSSGIAAGIYDLRRLKIKHCAEPVGKARSVPDFCLSITQNVQVTPESLQRIQKGKPTSELPTSPKI